MSGEHNPYEDESMSAAAPPDEDARISSAEFKKRYGRKRFTGRSAPKAVLWGFLYSCHELAEPEGIRSELYSDMQSIKDLIETYEDMDTWNGYMSLVEWHRSNYNSAVLLRVALRQQITDLYDVADKLINAERLKAEAGKLDNPRLNLLLHNLTLESYAVEKTARDSIVTLRNNIGAGYRYILAYNTFIDVLAEETKTPEYNILRIKTKELRFVLHLLNDKLEDLRNTIAETREAEASGTSDSIITPEMLRETMEAFRPIKENPAPIPEDRIRKARGAIQQGIRTGLYSWHSVFFELTTAYWGEVE